MLVITVFKHCDSEHRGVKVYNCR